MDEEKWPGRWKEEMVEVVDGVGIQGAGKF